MPLVCHLGRHAKHNLVSVQLESADLNNSIPTSYPKVTKCWLHKMTLSDNSKDLTWMIAFTLVDSFNRIFYGMYSTLLGPSQPYLARKVNVDIDTITWIQPFGKY